MRGLHRGLSVLILLIGLVHAVGTFVFYPEFDAGALWFLGSGLFVITAAVLNLLLARAPEVDAWLARSVIGVDAGGAILGTLSIPLVGGAPAYALTALFLATGLLTLVQYRSQHGTPS